MRLRNPHFLLLPAFLLFTGSTLDDGSVPLPGSTPTDTAQVKKPMTTADKIRAKRLNIPLDTAKGDFGQQVLAMENEPFAGTDMQARIDKVQHDNIGYTHIRLQQYYKGIPVDGATKIVHINKKNVLYDVDGAFARRLNVDVTPDISAERAKEIAMDDAWATQCTDNHCGAWKDADQQTLFEYERLRTAGQDPVWVLKEPSLIVTGGSIAYIVSVRERGIDEADWEYWVDGHSGGIIKKYNTICYALPPNTTVGRNATITGVKLHREINPATNDSVVSFTGWQDTSSGGDHHYYMYYKGNADSGYGPWAVHHGVADWEQLDSANWTTLDRSAVSAAKNMQLVTKWMGDTLDRYGFDNTGKFLKVYVHTGSSSFSGADSSVFLSYGDAAKYMDTGSVLEVVAHEVGHGITHTTSHLDAEDFSRETGALSESYSHIIGAAVEFACQPDSSARYPGTQAGTADWLVGEDQSVGHLAAFDMRYPQRDTSLRDTLYYGSAGSDHPYEAYYDGTQFNATNWDKYTRTGPQNFAFYLLAKGNDQTRYNDGHAYGVFGGIGVAGAAQVAMRANTVHLQKYDTYHDSRVAWLKAAVELIDECKIPANAVAIAESAWTAAGVKPELRFRHLGEDPNRTKAQIGQVGNLKLSYGTTTTAPTSGDLRFSKSGTWKAASRSDGAFSYADTLTANDSTFLDDSTLVGGLVIKGPDGKVRFFVDGSGHVRIRQQVEGMRF